MNRAQPSILLQYLRKLVSKPGSQGLSDRELLRRFAEQRDEAAFTTLVHRHGPMVLGLCQRLLQNGHDAEDVCQATFLVLASKAASRYWQPSVASWLHRVAYHLAQKAKAAAVRRTIHERHVRDRSVADPLETLTGRELRAVLDEELARLPEKYRAPLVLCYLEGATRDEAALRLGCPLGTLKSRLERGRELLRIRLTKRGVAVPAVLSVALLMEKPVDASVSVLFWNRIAQGALSFTGLKMVTGQPASAVALALAEKALKSIALTKLQIMTTLLLLLGVWVGGATAVAYRAWAGEQVTGQIKQETKPLAEELGLAHADMPKAGRTDLYGDPLPPGALARMGTVQLRHGGNAAFSPDGKVLATVDEHSLRLWGMASGKQLLQLKDKFQWGPALFSPHGKWLAIPVNGSLCLLDPATGTTVRRIPNARWALAFSPDSQLVATNATDSKEGGTVFLWNTLTGQKVFSLRGPAPSAHVGTAFTPDGRTFVTLSLLPKQRSDAILNHWDVATGTLRHTAVLHLPAVSSSLNLSPDGQTIACAPKRSNTISLWDTTTGKPRATLEGGPADRREVTFTADSRTLAIAAFQADSLEAKLSLWDVGTGKKFRSFTVPHRAVDFMQFAPDGRTLLTVSSRPRIYLWDTTTGQPRWQRPAHDGGLISLCFTPDGHTLVSGSDDGSIRVWTAETGKQIRVLPGHVLGVHAVAVLPDGQKVLSGGYEGVIRLQELWTGKELRRLVIDPESETVLRPAYNLHALHLTTSGRRVTSFSYRSQQGPNPRLSQVWDLVTGQPLVHCANHSEIFFDSFSPDGTLMAGFVDTLQPVESDYSVAVVEETATGREIVRLSQPDAGRGYPVAFAPDGQTCATMTSQYRRAADDSYFVDRHAIHVWELATGKERLTIANNEPGEGFRYVQLAFSPDGRTLTTARGDHLLQIWDVATGQELFRRPGYDVDITGHAFVVAPDGRTLATGHVDSTILTWDLAPETWRRASRSGALTVQELEAAWADLASPDARKAHEAIWKLVAVPQQAVPLLRERLHPAPALPAERLHQLLNDLNSSQFRRREAATKQLADLEEQAEPALRAALKDNVSAEQRERIEPLLAGPRLVRSPEKLRALRAIEVLEQCPLPEARQVLKKLAEGPSEARLTQEAKAALERLCKRVDSWR